MVQNDWMALNKKKHGVEGWVPAIVHALTYTMFFALFVTTSWKALAVICVTHAVIDHYEFVPKIVWLRNWIAPKWIKQDAEVDGVSNSWMERNPPWEACKPNFGFSPIRPQFLAFWLYVIIDNTLHITINYASVRWL